MTSYEIRWRHRKSMLIKAVCSRDSRNGGLDKSELNRKLFLPLRTSLRFFTSNPKSYLIVLCAKYLKRESRLFYTKVIGLFHKALRSTTLGWRFTVYYSWICYWIVTLKEMIKQLILTLGHWARITDEYCTIQLLRTTENMLPKFLFQIISILGWFYFCWLFRCIYRYRSVNSKGESKLQRKKQRCIYFCQGSQQCTNFCFAKKYELRNRNVSIGQFLRLK